MKQIQLPGGVLMVEIDKGWFEFEFNEANSRVLMFLTSEDIQHITVPPGKWEIIGLGKDLNNGDPDNDEILEYMAQNDIPLETSLFLKPIKAIEL